MPNRRDRWLLLLLFLHPLWNFGRFVDLEPLLGPMPLAAHSGMYAFLLESAVTAFLALGLTDRRPSLCGPVPSVDHEGGLGGFRLQMRPISLGAYLWRAFRGTSAAVSGLALFGALYIATNPITASEVSTVAFFFALLLISYAVTTGVCTAFAGFIWNRMQELAPIELEGRVLRTPKGSLAITGPAQFEPMPGGMVVRSGEQELMVRAPEGVLRWVRAKLQALPDGGEVSDIPEVLRRVRRVERNG